MSLGSPTSPPAVADEVVILGRRRIEAAGIRRGRRVDVGELVCLLLFGRRCGLVARFDLHLIDPIGFVVVSADAVALPIAELRVANPEDRTDGALVLAGTDAHPISLVELLDRGLAALGRGRRVLLVTDVRFVEPIGLAVVALHAVTPARAVLVVADPEDVASYTHALLAAGDRDPITLRMDRCVFLRLSHRTEECQSLARPQGGPKKGGNCLPHPRVTPSTIRRGHEGPGGLGRTK